MDATEIKKEPPDAVVLDPTGFNVASDGIKLEISEIGDPVPFKIFQVENIDGEPNIYRMEVPAQTEWIADATYHQPGPSNVGEITTDPHSSSSPPPNKRMKTEPTEYTSNNTKHPSQLENNKSTEIVSSDDDVFSAESDLEYGGDSERDSECEYISDDNLPPHTGDAKPKGKFGDFFEDSWCRDNPPEWTTDDTSMKQIKFTKKRELHKPIPKTPYETFRWFLNNQILDTIVNETNKYATYILTKKKLAPTSRFKAWKDVTREELVTFLSLLIHTGTIRINRLADYWKKDYLFNLNCFSRFMAHSRFMLILNCLNFASLDSESHEEDSIAKIKPFVQNFNDVMNDIYYPGKELLIAKSIVFWQGRLVRQEYTDHRRHRNVVNLIKLAEPNGIVLKFQVDFGNSADNIFRVLKGEIVEELVADKLGCGHSVYMDKCYSSYRLALRLLQSQTYCTGTLNKKTRNNPFREAARSTQAEKQSPTSFFSKGVHVGYWRGHKPTLYITTEFKNELYQVLETNGTISHRSKALVNFSRFMTCSELQDQLMSFLPCSRKNMHWYKKVFIYTLQIYMNNAFHLFNNFSGNGKKMDYYDYRLSVLKAMLPASRPAMVVSEPSLAGHVLMRITRTRQKEKQKKDGTVSIVNQAVRKECTICRRRKHRTATPFECTGCAGSPGYCKTCFYEVHSTKEKPFTTTDL